MDNKISKIIKKYDILINEFNDKKRDYKYISPINYFNDNLFKKISYNINSNEDENKVINSNNNLLNSMSYPFLYINKYVINSLYNSNNTNILMILQNIYFIDILIPYINSNITVIIYNIYYINDIIKLKEKYKNMNIYFIGNNIDYCFYDNIKNKCNNKKFNTIMFDNGQIFSSYIHYQKYLINLGILLCNDFLIKNGCFIQHSYIPRLDNKKILCLLNIQYDQFKYHEIGDTHYYYFNKNIPTTYIFYGYNNNLNELIYNNLKNSLKKFYKNKFKKINYEITNDFLYHIYTIYKSYYLKDKEAYNVMINKNNLISGGDMCYHKIRYGRIPDMDKIPITINDLKKTYKYDDNDLNYHPICHWGQKKLLLSEIQLFTNIIIDNNNLKNDNLKNDNLKDNNLKDNNLRDNNLRDYICVYVGSAPGIHLPILFDMFPELEWLLYDPAKYYKLIYQHKYYNKKVFIFNEFFNDDTIEQVIKYNKHNKKIIFISDIRINNNEINIINDMKNQAIWGMKLNAKYMLLKFRIPYLLNNYVIDHIPKNINDLKFDKNKINNFDLKINNCDEMIYLKGDILLQLFSPQYSGELRLFVKQNNNKYDLDIYNYKDIETKIYRFNEYNRNEFTCNNKQKICENIPLNYIKLIPGYDNCIECIMEYLIMKDYLYYYKNIDDNIKIIKFMYEMNILLEKYTNRNIYNCNLVLINKKPNKNSTIWIEIMKILINTSIYNQIKYIKYYGNDILGNKIYDQSIKYLNKYYDNKLKYYEFII